MSIGTSWSTSQQVSSSFSLDAMLCSKYIQCTEFAQSGNVHDVLPVVSRTGPIGILRRSRKKDGGMYWRCSRIHAARLRTKARDLATIDRLATSDVTPFNQESPLLKIRGVFQLESMTLKNSNITHP